MTKITKRIWLAICSCAFAVSLAFTGWIVADTNKMIEADAAEPTVEFTGVYAYQNNHAWASSGSFYATYLVFNENFNVGNHVGDGSNDKIYYTHADGTGKINMPFIWVNETDGKDYARANMLMLLSGSALYNDAVLHIDEGTDFAGKILPKVSLTLENGRWDAPLVGTNDFVGFNIDESGNGNNGKWNGSSSFTSVDLLFAENFISKEQTKPSGIYYTLPTEGHATKHTPEFVWTYQSSVANELEIMYTNSTGIEGNAPNGYPEGAVMHIEEGTYLGGKYLSELTLYMADGKWVDKKPVVEPTVTFTDIDVNQNNTSWNNSNNGWMAVYMTFTGADLTGDDYGLSATLPEGVSCAPVGKAPSNYGIWRSGNQLQFLYYLPKEVLACYNVVKGIHVAAQIEDMHKAGIGGFIMHARTGLKIEYLGEKWFSCIEACLKKAKELGMEAWVYDENGWPSGFVGGKLLEKEEYLAQFLTYEVKDCFDDGAFAVYQKTEDGYSLIDGVKTGVGEYHTVYLHTSPANTDILNPEVVDAFIQETYEEYYKRFKDSFGKELVGFFTDEPQYYRWETPYSKCVAEEFRKEGLNVRVGLIYLFIQDKAGYEFRTKYYSTLNKLYVQNFYKKIYDWCDSHNCKLTGHSIEESVLAFQMMSCAGVTPTYEFEHMPAVDWLGKVIPHELMMKQVGSVASQLGKKHILTETFACSGYETTPRELKSIAEFQYFGGVNRTCQHLYPYSLAAQGKFDHPPFFAKHSNWFNEFKTFNTYFDRLGFIIGETKEIYDVGIIHPMRSIYLDFLRSDYIYSVKDFDDIFVGLLDTLAANGITYHLIDESILERHGKNVGDTLQVGNCQYNTIIIPDMPTIASTTLALLKAFKGKLLSLGGLEYVDGIPKTVSLQSNITFDDIVANTAVKVKNKGGRYALNARKGEIGEFIFIKNHSNEASCSLDVENFAEYKALDLTTLTISAIEKHNEIAGGDGLILLKDNTPCEKVKIIDTVDITNTFAVKDITENYLVLDQVAYSFDGIDYTEKMPVSQAFEQLLRMDYKGKLFVKYDFEVKDLVGARLLLEKAKYESLTVNGQEVEFLQSNFDFLFQEGDISKYLRRGKNEIAYSMEYYQHDGVHFALFDPMATESVKNCLYYDTSIENIYIYGDFSLDEHYTICEKKLPAAINGIEKQGYPFFKGKVVYVGNYTYSGEGRATLTLDGDYLVAHIAANGKDKEVVMDTTVDISDLLKEGGNHLEITIHTSLRNLFGPHHASRDAFICPSVFTFRGQWENGEPSNYIDDYQLVNIGIKKIEIKEIK